ncbi:MAG: dTMP kinase [Candidatus Acidiferrales bacterium]
MRETYGKVLPGMRLADLTGKLIVIEGTDGAGRTTQIELLKPWLEELGHAVLDTGMTRSTLAGDGIRRAKEGNNLGRVTQSLFYATDFIDRLENEIVPALRAGFIVLTDRYVYSLMARAIVRGMDPQWIRSIFSVALKPDAVFYLRLGIEQLVPRVVFSRGFDYWESGMDLYPGHDMYDSFCNYQAALLAEFDRLGEEFKFETVDASADSRCVFSQLKVKVLGLLESDSRKRFQAMLAMGADGHSMPRAEEDTIAAAARKHSVTRDLELVSQPFAAQAPRGNGNGHAETQHWKP